MQTRLLAIDRDKPVNVGGLQDYRVIPRTNWVFENKLQNIFIFFNCTFTITKKIPDKLSFYICSLIKKSLGGHLRINHCFQFPQRTCNQSETTLQEELPSTEKMNVAKNYE